MRKLQQEQAESCEVLSQIRRICHGHFSPPMSAAHPWMVLNALVIVVTANSTYNILRVVFSCCELL